MYSLKKLKMQDKHTYKYAVIRFLPRVEREEFFNVGVILFCKRLKYLDVQFHVNTDILKAFSSEIDVETITEYLNSWKLICEGKANKGKERYKKSEIHKTLERFKLTKINIQSVTPGLESKK